MNYNDGRWHGWNGGECPVMPRDVVEVQHISRQTSEAECFDWGYGGRSQIVAFRVIKEHKEPREWFGWMGASGHCEFFNTEEGLNDHVEKFGRDITRFKVREVLDDES